MLLTRRTLSMGKGASFSRAPWSVPGPLQRAAGASGSAKFGEDPLPRRLHGVCGGVAGMSTSSRRAGYEAMRREANSDDAWREAEKKIIATLLEMDYQRSREHEALVAAVQKEGANAKEASFVGKAEPDPVKPVSFSVPEDKFVASVEHESSELGLGQGISRLGADGESKVVSRRAAAEGMRRNASEDNLGQAEFLIRKTLHEMERRRDEEFASLIAKITGKSAES